MEKITILCGMENRQKAEKFMEDVVAGIQNRGFSVRDTNDKYLILETEYTRTAFIYDEHAQPLNGVKADAIFGMEPYKQKLAVYLKELIPYKIGQGLVDYICRMEAESKHRPKQIWVTSARSTGKTAFMKELERYLHKDEFVSYSKADCDITYDLYKKHIGKPQSTLPEIKDVIFNNPATIVIWADGTKTVVQSRGDDIYDPEKGLAMAISKKIMGNKHEYYHIFLHWLKKA